jgi:hypothetical protein
MAVTIETADTYFQTEVLLNDAWVNATLEQKGRALKNAENSLYRFYRRFDRVEKPIPEQAIYEQAYFLLLVDETIQKSALGVKQVSISGVSISVNAPSYPLSPEVKQIMVAHGAGGVRLGRSRL